MGNKLKTWLFGIGASVLLGCAGWIGSVLWADHDELVRLQANDKNDHEMLQEIREDVKELRRMAARWNK